MSSVSALFSCQFPLYHKSPSTTVPELSCSFPSLDTGGIGSQWCPAERAVPAPCSQLCPSTACTTCTLCWNPNSRAPVCCLQRKRMLSSRSVQFKITEMLLSLCLSKLLLFLLTDNTLLNDISFTPPLCCSLYYTSHAATGPATVNPASV